MLQHAPRQQSSNANGQSAQGATQQAPQRKKKASRACFHCQKAHLTCNDARPCQRCVKRDLAASCTDGIRKRAKYLQEEEPVDSQQQQTVEDSQPKLHQGHELQQLSMEDSSLGDAASLFSFASVQSSTPISASELTNEYGFSSDAVNLEYSFLSTILSSPSQSASSPSSSPASMSDLSTLENWQRQNAIEAMANTLSQRGHNHQQLQRALLNQQLQQQQQQQQIRQLNGDGHNKHTTTNANTNANATDSAITSNTSSLPTLQKNGRPSKRKHLSNTPENVYANTKQPFNYTEGFHYLLRYVRERMDKEEIMRICRAMATFRPSFIALIMNLTPEDLIFMETCFQRTVLEYEKLISYSGTPTVVWRRTGEIALVGKEFSLLTQWSREQLVGKKTYIYELMDNQSAVEYWEKFSSHAFENTEQTVMATCILLSPTKRVVPCTFCFTIKRDIFDIPLAIVGNFLPILS
ncbi:Transcriptional regulator of nonfermentable carbon utilization [Podila epigama]|nr:Transcriptional regulator of nonfermentable carbon utilization [Podila epigama]